MSNPSSEFINNHCDYEPTSRLNEDVGGNSQQWKEQLEEKKQVLPEQTPQLGEDLVKFDYDLIEKNFNVVDAPSKLDPKQSTIEDIYLHARFTQRRKQKQVIKLLRYRKFMENHLIPVDFTSFENTSESFDKVLKHFRHREIIEFDECKKGVGTGALHNEWAVIRMHLEAYKIPYGKGMIWNYKAPKRPKRNRKKDIPLPQELHAMLHLKYSNNRAVDAMIKTMLTCNFFIGWRFPSEAYEACISDVDFDRQEILVHSQKYDWAERYVDIQQIAKRRNTKNLHNWITIWRPRIVQDPEVAGDALFLNPDGRPFDNEEQLRMWFERNVKPIAQKAYPRYYNYCSRHWNATARLIRSKIEDGRFDVKSVCFQMGHSKVGVTEGYTGHADYYYRKEPCDWFLRVLKYHPNADRGKHAKIAKFENDLGSEWNFFEKKRRRRPMVFNVSSVGKIAILPSRVFSDLASISIEVSLKSFFFSFFELVQILFFGLPSFQIGNWRNF